MAYENNDKRTESVYSQRVRAGKRRTYFFDIKETRSNDYYLTITESRKKFNEDGYERHKIFLYKEDFNKFLKGMTEAIDYVKTELMPDFDFDSFSHENENYEGHPYEPKGEDSGAATADPVTDNVPQAPVAETTPVMDTEPAKEKEPTKEKEPAEEKEPEKEEEPDEPANPTQHEEVDKW